MVADSTECELTCFLLCMTSTTMRCSSKADCQHMRRKLLAVAGSHHDCTHFTAKHCLYHTGCTSQHNTLLLHFMPQDTPSFSSLVHQTGMNQQLALHTLLAMYLYAALTVICMRPYVCWSVTCSTPPRHHAPCTVLAMITAARDVLLRVAQQETLVC